MSPPLPEAQWRFRKFFSIVALSKTLGSTEAVSATVPDVHGVAAFEAARRVVDQVERSRQPGASRTDKIAPTAALRKMNVSRADELLLAVRERDDGGSPRWIDDPHRPEARDAHAVELIEKTAMIGIGAALAHGPEATLRLRQAQSIVQRAAVRLLATLAVRDCLSCPYMSKRLAAAGFIPCMSAARQNPRGSPRWNP